MPFRLFEKIFLKLDATQNVHNECDGAARFDLYRRFYGNARDVGRSHERGLDMLFRVLFQNFQNGIDLRPFDADKKRHAFLFQKSAR